MHQPLKREHLFRRFGVTGIAAAGITDDSLQVEGKVVIIVDLFESEVGAVQHGSADGSIGTGCGEQQTDPDSIGTHQIFLPGGNKKAPADLRGASLPVSLCLGQFVGGLQPLLVERRRSLN
jgi:hypothetical protein